MNKKILGLKERKCFLENHRTLLDYLYENQSHKVFGDLILRILGWNDEMNEKANLQYEEEKELYQLVKILNNNLRDQLQTPLVLVEEEDGLRLRMTDDKGRNPWNQAPCRTQREMRILLDSMLDAMFNPERVWANQVASLRSGKNLYHVGDMRVAEECSMNEYPTQYGMFGIYCDANTMVQECRDGFKSFEEYLDRDFWQISKIELMGQQYLMMDTDLEYSVYAKRKRIPYTVICSGLTGRNIGEKMHELKVQSGLKEMEPLKHYIGLHIFKY